MAKNQHYVAQSYLKQFACDRRGKHPKICCYDKVRRAAFTTNVRNVASENYFYNSPDETAAVEEKFGRLESLFGESAGACSRYPI